MPRGAQEAGACRRGRGGRFLFCFLMMAALFLCAPGARGEGEPSNEYQVKAAFIYNFTRFVTWPTETATGRPASTLSVCILGKSPFDRAFELSEQRFKERRVVVTNVRAVADLPSCDVLFISASEKGRLQEILAGLGNRPVLTISDIKHFAAEGGMIGFVPLGEKVRFEINHRAALHANLRISAQLLKLATKVLE